MRQRQDVEFRAGTGMNGRLGPLSYFGGRMVGRTYGQSIGVLVSVYGLRQFNIFVEVTVGRQAYGIQVWKRGNEG